MIQNQTGIQFEKDSRHLLHPILELTSFPKLLQVSFIIIVIIIIIIIIIIQLLLLSSLLLLSLLLFSYNLSCR